MHGLRLRFHLEYYSCLGFDAWYGWILRIRFLLELDKNSSTMDMLVRSGLVFDENSASPLQS